MHIGIWPFNPKTMDDKTKLSDIYTTESSPNISDDDTINYNNVVDEDQWGGRWSYYTTIEYINMLEQNLMCKSTQM
jgi:hypothetical protein